ncbi:hypothetical protein BDV32DRAFT_161586 [Aspergillus pseudonomiae]|uniref:Uncharacterized protein n=1 Tax=Aspergillus pseudonomiae TaxID=1506151 RepID=A0A5N7DGF7_9EURO|nr:uncharacterized protein BDV37DRAFT_96401 [Aspergillus pseudonomiae]KAB8255865.1 hypothetical protein BDV32DRAFT_161586 [Aspergillus pseudonomiae]KAE8405374.1 hypothetical protein BDV37DRAFT_96401 [Aspergillus pseudonomiae]
MNPTLNADTPPPPPPKPTSHEASRRGTPQLHASQPGTPQSQRYRADASMHAATNPITSLPRPPTVDEGWIPEIVKEKSTVDLQTILKDPSLISALASRHPSHAAHQEYLQSLLKYNKDLAAHVLELQGRVMDLRGSTETLLLTHQSLEVSWRKKQSEMDAALAPWSPKALYQRLAASIAEQEAVCHAVEESFLEGEHHGRATEKEVADWIRRVRAEGAKLEARREAKARWDEGRVGGWR